MSDFDLGAAFQHDAKEFAEGDALVDAMFPSTAQEQAEPAPVVEPEVQAAQPASTQSDDEPEDLTPPWARDLRDGVHSLQRQFIHQQYQQQQQRQQAPQQETRQERVEREASRVLTDLDGEHLTKRLEQLENYAQAMAQSVRYQEMQAFQHAEKRLREQFPDFDEVVPASQRQAALHQALQGGRFGNDWQSNMSNAYKLFAFDKHVQKKDELTNKREAKKDETRKVAAQIPPSGANYQAPAARLEQGKRGYRDADAAFLASLRSVM